MFKQSDISIALKGAILVAFLLLSLLLLFVLNVLLDQGELERSKEAHSRAVVATTERLSKFSIERESVIRQSTPTPQLGQQIKYVLFVEIALNFIAIITVALFLKRDILRRLQVVIENMKRLESKHKLLPAIDGKDEIGQLDKALHKVASALEQAARRERAIVDNAEDVICSIDQCNKFMTISPACLRSWGYSIEEMLGKKLEDIVIGNNLSANLSFKNKFESQSSGSPLELKIRHKDGKVIPTVWSAFWSEEEQALFCITRDLSEKKAKELLLKESTTRVRLILESMPVGLVVIDDKGHIDLANSKIAHMYGAPPKEFMGQHIQFLLTELNLTDSLASQLEKFAGCLTESWMACANGAVLPVDVTVNEFMMHGQCKILLSIIDVRERHQIERLRQELQSMIKEDFRSPLTSIKASLAMLATGTMGSLTESGNQFLQRARHASDRLIEMINDLLDIEKVRSGRMQLELTPVLVSSIIQHTVDSTSYLAEQKGIRIETQGYQKDIYADEARVVQVLVNLVSNAIKFSSLGSTVKIDVVEIPEWLEFRITDEGRGIPKDSLNKIFEKYSQANSSNGHRGYGKGMGLAIAQAIIEQHDGIIGVESEEGRGSTFWFRLPHNTSL